MKTKKVTNILWDTDGEIIDDLPDEVVVDADIPDDEIADYLSDNQGFCILGFAIEP